MGRVVVSENVTLDGVVQDPMGDEGFPHGGWVARASDADRAAWAALEHEEALDAGALLLGRRTYEWFAARWPSRTGAWADRLNAMPKHVVSATLTDPDWTNTAVLGVDAVPALRQEADGDLVVYGSRVLVRTLLDRGLVDELRLVVYPSVLGAGERLFADVSELALQFAGTRVLGDGLVLLTYRR